MHLHVSVYICLSACLRGCICVSICLPIHYRLSPPGYCESEENCLWKAPVAGEARERKYTTSEAAEATKTLKSYGIGISIILGVAVTLGVVNLIVMLFMIICRCCCKCCGAVPRDDGYTRAERYVPVFFFVVSGSVYVHRQRHM